MDGKEQLERNLGELEEVVGSTAERLRRLPDKAVGEGASWGPREILSHYLFWHERTCLNVEDVLAGKSIEPIARPVDEVNSEAVASRRAKSMNAMIEELLGLQRRLAADFKKIGDPNTIVLIRANGTKLNAVERLEVMSKHIKSHWEELGNS